MLELSTSVRSIAANFNQGLLDPHPHLTEGGGGIDM